MRRALADEPTKDGPTVETNEREGHREAGFAVRFEREVVITFSDMEVLWSRKPEGARRREKKKTRGKMELGLR